MIVPHFLLLLSGALILCYCAVLCEIQALVLRRYFRVNEEFAASPIGPSFQGEITLSSFANQISQFAN